MRCLLFFDFCWKNNTVPIQMELGYFKTNWVYIVWKDLGTLMPLVLDSIGCWYFVGILWFWISNDIVAFVIQSAFSWKNRSIESQDDFDFEFFWFGISSRKRERISCIRSVTENDPYLGTFTRTYSSGICLNDWAMRI
jgi:hypothetical protein